MKTSLLAAVAFSLTLPLGLAACGDDSGDTDLSPPQHDLSATTTDMAKKPNIDAGETD
jgi:hypothetical protein